MIRLNVFITVSDEHRADFIATATELVAESQQEQGCIAYDLYESTTRPNVLMICETWADQESLTAHEGTPHYMELVPKMAEMAEIKVEKLQM